MKWLAMAGVFFAACAPCTQSDGAATNVSCGQLDSGVVLYERPYTNLNPPGLLSCTGTFDGTTLTFSVRREVCENGSTAPGFVECTVPQLPSGRYALPGGQVLLLPNDGGVASCE